MSKLALLITGAVLGFVAAHFVNQTPGGRRFFDRLGQGAREFGDAVAAGYRGAEGDSDPRGAGETHREDADAPSATPASGPAHAASDSTHN